MNITIINDCRDANAAGRQSTRAATLMKGAVNFVGVKNDIEAAGNLIDILDAYGDSEGVILVNVAPRNGAAKKWPNGTPFGYFWYQNVLVVTSVDGLTLSLVKKLKLVSEVHVMDIPTIIERFVAESVITTEVGKHIVDTQFRSYDFLPRVAAYLLEHKEVVSDVAPLDTFADAPAAVWFVDNFGNCKTTLSDSDLATSETIATKLGGLKYYNRLKDVPDKETAIITGSSGLNDHRFLEIVVQGESAADSLKLASGDAII